MRTIKTIIKYGLGIGLIILATVFLFPDWDIGLKIKSEEKKEGDPMEKIIGRFEQEFLMTRDLKTNTVPTERLIKAYQTAQQKRAQRSAHAFPIYWQERGPNNVGGRTRALLIDANDPTQQTVWAGGVSGGLWRTTNIDAANPNWVQVDDLFDNLAITTITQDPNNPDSMYFGTGEGHYTCPDCGVRGLGIWRSTDGGATWNILNFTFSTPTFYWVNKIVIDNTGQVYAATRNGGIQFLPVGGVSFTQILGDGNGAFTNRADDIEIAANGDIYAAMKGDGIYRFRNGIWTQMNVPTPNPDFQRIELATAPSDGQTVYAAYEDDGGYCFGVYITTDGGTTWNTRSCPTSLCGGNGQCGYDLIMAVDPNDALRIWLGGVRLFVSADSAANWTQVTGVHVDHHAIAYRPGNSDEIVFGNDGGVYRSLNGSAITPTLTERNGDYNVTQFYSVALNPDSASNEMLGGTQDNSTPVFSTPGIGPTFCVLCCCDGGYAHIDQNNPLIQIASIQDGRFSLSTTGSTGPFTIIVPGSAPRFFITPSAYDSDNNILYFSDSLGTFGRVTDVGVTNMVTIDTVAQFGNSRVFALAVSPNTANRVFMAAGGEVFQIDNAHMNGAVNPTALNSPGMGWTSSIAVEDGDDQHLLVTYSNYGVVSVWETTNGGTSWSNVEGDLPDMPVRWAMFHPFDAEQALLATQLGVWTTGELDSTSTIWSPTNSYGLANVRVDMLQYRSSDHVVAAATHGRGVFTTDYFTRLAFCEPNLNLSGAISPGIYIVDEVITSDGTVQDETAVIYQAGEMVLLEDNFTAEKGSDFWALILPCDTAGSFSSKNDVFYLKKSKPKQVSPKKVRWNASITEDEEMLYCYPIPSQTSATIDYHMAKEKKLRIVVMNARGELVDVVAEGHFKAGLHRFHWDASQYQNGLYIIQDETPKSSKTEKVFVVR